MAGAYVVTKEVVKVVESLAAAAVAVQVLTEWIGLLTWLVQNHFDQV